MSSHHQEEVCYTSSGEDPVVTKETTEVELPKLTPHDSEDEGGAESGDELLVIDCTVAGQCTERGQVLRSSNRRPWRWHNAALPLHYIAAGMMLHVVQGLLYGVLLGIMAVPGRVYTTARIFVLAPWCLKCVFGCISDCFPINGYHRRHYCSLGWLLSVLAHLLLALVFHEPEQPKYCIDAGHGDLGNYVPEAGVCNPRADEDSAVVTILLTVSVLGVTVAESAADGLTMECAQSWQQLQEARF